MESEPEQQEEEGPSEIDVLKDTVRELRAQNRRAVRTSAGNERVLRAIEEAVFNTEPFALPYNLPPRMSTNLDIEAPHHRMSPNPDIEAPHHRQFALWSDWHYGETVSGEQMNGLNEFNVAVAEERVQQLVQSMLKFKRVRPALTGLNIGLLGDMASGMIHKLEETNEIPAAEQYVRVGYLIASAIAQLAPHYPEIVIDAIVGNHPRAAKEPASKDAYNNGDWVAYQMAKALTAHLDNVSWNIPPGGMVVREFAGKNFLLWHGDGVKSNAAGVPWVAITRRVNSLKEAYGTMGVRIDYVVVGHFHQRSVVPGVYMNGSLIGPNEYGLKNFGGGEPAKQLLITFDEKRRRETDVSTISFEAT